MIDEIDKIFARHFVAKETPTKLGEWGYNIPALKKELVKLFRNNLKQPNLMLRSAYSVAERWGADTNWVALGNQLKKELDREHKIMYPKAYERK